jgi:hypothetical protein
MKKAASSLVLATLITASLAACVVTPPHVAVRAPAVTIWAPVAPPPPRVEIVPPAPRRDYVWIPGYWHWESNQHHWREGYWEAPHEREHWVPHRWERDDRDQWRLNGGYWHRD